MLLASAVIDERSDDGAFVTDDARDWTDEMTDAGAPVMDEKAEAREERAPCAEVLSARRQRSSRRVERRIKVNG
jgi:hypothetical protein